MAYSNGGMDGYDIYDAGSYTVTVSSPDSLLWKGDLWNYDEYDELWYEKGSYEYYVDVNSFVVKLYSTDESLELWFDEDSTINPDQVTSMAGRCILPGEEADSTPLTIQVGNKLISFEASEESYLTEVYDFLKTSFFRQKGTGK